MSPWTPKDAQRHDKKAKSAHAQKQWSEVANSVLKATGDEGRAVREANGVVMRQDMAKFKGKASAKRQGKRSVNRYA